MELRDQLDRRFAALARLVVRRPWLTIVLVLVPVLGLASQLRHVRFDTSTEGFLHAEDPTLVAYNGFRDQFGRDELLILALEPPEIFDLGFLERLRALHEDLEERVPHLDEVTSLINARATRGSEGELLVEDLLEEWPEDEQALREVEAYVMANPSYRNLLVSEDGRMTTVAIRTSAYSSASGPGEDADATAGFDDTAETRRTSAPVYLTDTENSEVVAAVRAVVAEHAGPDFPILVAGSPMVTDVVKRSMQRNMLLFVRLTIVAIVVLLYLLFRRIAAVLLPLAVVIFSLVCTIGLMVATGSALKLPTMILPSFLLAVGVGDSVHVLALYFRGWRAGASREEAIVGAIEHSGLPIVLTSLTTAGGLASFASTALAPIADLGIFAPLGVMIALVLSLTLLPALLAVTPMRAFPAPDRPGAPPPHPMDGFLAAAGDAAGSHPWVVLGASSLIALVSLAGMLQLRLSHHPLRWLPEDEPVRIASERIDEQMRGTITMEVVLGREGENAWYAPESLRAVESMERFAESFRDGDVYFGRAFSAVDVLKEINRALNENRDDHYTIPDDRDLIAQEFLLFENSGSDDLENLVDSRFTRLRLSMKAPFHDAVAYSRTLPAVEAELASTFGNDTKILVTGLMPLLMRTMTAVVDSLVQSYAIAFVVITLLMVALIGSVKLGLVAMVPNVLPILMTLGLMGYTGMQLDTFTLLIGSIALGLAVDDTIHFMHNYRRYQRETGDSQLAIHRTLETTGRAMLFTTLVLSCGFLIFTLSDMVNIFNFGLLTSFAISMALLADFLLAPALMHLLHRERPAAGAADAAGTIQ